jgi:hypothetical protein
MHAWAALASSSVPYALATEWAATQLPPDGGPMHFDAGESDEHPHKSLWLAGQREPGVRRMLAADMALIMSATLAFLSLIPLWTVLGAKATVTPLLAPVVLGTDRGTLE